MKHYIGLDVSMKETSICIVDEKGKIVYEGTEESNPSLLANHIQKQKNCHGKWLFKPLAGFRNAKIKFSSHLCRCTADGKSSFDKSK